MNSKIAVYMYNLELVKRFNRFGHPSGNRQSYAIHGYNSLAISSVISHKHNMLEKENPVNIERIYGKLIFGSLHPTFFGDVPKSIQEQYPDLAKAFKVAKKANGENLVLEFSQTYRDIFSDYLLGTYDGTIESEVVRQSENFSVLMKCEEELKAVSNRYFKKLKQTVKEYVQNGGILLISDEIKEELQEEEYENFEQKTFFDIYLDTVKSIMNSPLESVKWYFSEVYFTPFTLIINNMKEVYRWNNVDINDTDSQHSFYVAMWSFILGLIERLDYNQNVQIDQLVSKSIFHDIHESLTSDILSYIKRINKKVKELIDIMEDDKNHLILCLLPVELQDTFKSYICDAKSNDIEGELVHVADKIDAAIKALREMKRRNSTYFQESYDNCIRDVMDKARKYNSVKDFFTYMIHEFHVAKE